MAYSYAADAWIDAHTALLALIAAGTGSSHIRIYGAEDVLLFEVDIDEAETEVNATTGTLTIVPGSTTDTPASGIASYCQIEDGDDTPIIQMDCQAGVSAVSGYCVINTLSVVEDQVITIVSCSVPAGSTIS